MTRRRVLLFVMLCALVAPSAALAHVNLLSSDPVTQSRLDTPPTAVRLRFNEPVTISANAVEVLAPDGTVVSGTARTEADGYVVVAPVSGLARGNGYTVRWRVIGDDGHSPGGVFTFGVGVAAPPPTEAVGASGTTWRDDLARWGLFAALALLIGQDVVAAVPQRRNRDVEHLQPVEQVLAEGATGHRLVQVAVGRGDHPDVRFDEPRATEALELAFLQHAQELRLRGEAHLGHLVEEQHAARRQFDLAGLGLVRAREGAALVAKQLGLEQLLGQRGAIQRDERPVPARRRGMDEPRDDFLAGARFAGNEHGGIRRGDLRGVAQHPAPFNRLADDPQVGARRRMVESSRPGGVDSLHTIVVDVVVRLLR